MDNNISSRALLVWLTISTWSARRYDKQVSRKVNAEYHAADDAGRYNKMLLPGDADSYKTLIALAGSARAWHYAQTLCWSDEGWRVLPTANYMDYTAGLRKQISLFDAARDTFVADYPTLRNLARTRLGSLYNNADYPDPKDVRQRFEISSQVAPIPCDSDIRVNLGQDAIDDITKAVRSQTQRAVELAMSDAWKRLQTVVTAVSTRLSIPNAIFHDSLIKNVHDVCTALGRLNVTEDPALTTMCDTAIAELTRYTPDTLRENDYVRAETAQKAQDILTAMQGVYGVIA